MRIEITIDDELPGMWELADLIGGETDAAEMAAQVKLPKKPVIWDCPNCGTTYVEPHPHHHGLYRCSNCKEWMPSSTGPWRVDKHGNFQGRVPLTDEKPPKPIDMTAARLVWNAGTAEQAAILLQNLVGELVEAKEAAEAELEKRTVNYRILADQFDDRLHKDRETIKALEKRVTAQAAVIENYNRAINFETNCLSCAKMVDAMAQTAERLEQCIHANEHLDEERNGLLQVRDQVAGLLGEAKREIEQLKVDVATVQETRDLYKRQRDEADTARLERATRAKELSQALREAMGVINVHVDLEHFTVGQWENWRNLLED